MLVFTLHLKVDAKQTTVNEMTRIFLKSKLRVTDNKCLKEKIMTLSEVIQKDRQKHLYVNSAITSGTTQYIFPCAVVDSPWFWLQTWTFEFRAKN